MNSANFAENDQTVVAAQTTPEFFFFATRAGVNIWQYWDEAMDLDIESG